MIDLLLVLAPIALVDSTSLVPLCIVPMAVMLGGEKPLATSFSFIAAIVLTYLPFGVLLLFGLDSI